MIFRFDIFELYTLTTNPSNARSEIINVDTSLLGVASERRRTTIPFRMRSFGRSFVRDDLSFSGAVANSSQD